MIHVGYILWTQVNHMFDLRRYLAKAYTVKHRTPYLLSFAFERWAEQEKVYATREEKWAAFLAGRKVARS